MLSELATIWSGNHAFSEIMAEYPEPTISDVLADCVLASAVDIDSDFVRGIDDKDDNMEEEMVGFEPATGIGRPLTEADFMNVDAMCSESTDESVFIFAEDAENFMWSQQGEEALNMIEVEVISTWRDGELVDNVQQLTNLDQKNDGGYGSQSPDTESGAESREDYNSDYGSESGTDQTSDMDLSINGARNFTGRTSSFEETHHSTNFIRAHSHHSQSGALDLTLPNALRENKDMLNLNGMRHGLSAFNGLRNPYMHYSGGVAHQLAPTNTPAALEEATSLIDLSNSGKYYQLPKLKLEPGFGIVQEPCVPFKESTDCNHNESYEHQNTCHPEFQSSENISAFHSVKSEPSAFNSSNHQTLTVPQDNISDISCPASEYDSNTESFSGTGKSDEYSSQCRIPLTVTSADDDNDSGTESVDSKNSEKSSTEKGNKKRPGRKKGQVSKVYHLWEFIRDVLADPNKNPTVIKWENEEEGIFRVVQSEVAADLWGNKKNNRTKMTYEKMSRSIRYSRKEGYFADIPRDKGYPKKLCFKFGQKAHGWRQTFNKSCSTK